MSLANFVATPSTLVTKPFRPQAHYLEHIQMLTELIWGRIAALDFPMRPVTGIEKLAALISADPTTINEDNCFLP